MTSYSIAERTAAARNSWEYRLHIEVDGRHIELLGDRFSLEELAAFYQPYYVFDADFSRAPDVSIYVMLESKVACERDLVTNMVTYLEFSEFTSPEPGFLHTRRPGTAIELIVAADHRSFFFFGAHRTELMLQLRTFVRDQIFQQLHKQNGCLLIHAAAVEKNGVGVIFAGDRSAGKTSALMAFAARGDYNLVSTDRTVLRESADTVLGAGLPVRCNIHRVAFDNDPILQRLPERESLLKAMDSEGKILVSLEDIAHAAGVRVSREFRLGAVILPRIQGTAASLVVEQVAGSGQIVDLLRANELNGGSNDRSVQWLDSFLIAAEAAERSRNRVAKIIDGEAPVWRLTGSHAAYVSAIQQGIVETLIANAPR